MSKVSFFALLMFGIIRAQSVLPPSAIPDTSQRYQFASPGETVAMTVQQSTGTSRAAFEAAWVYCASACAFKLTQNGTAASATAGTIYQLNASAASGMKAYTASNAGSGTWTSQAYTLGAGGSVTVDLSRLYLTLAVGQNLTLVVTSGTLTNATIQWIEK